MVLEVIVISPCRDLPQSACELNQYRPKQQKLIKVGSVCGPLCCGLTHSLLVSWLNWCRVQQAAMIQWKWKDFWLPVC